MEMEFRVQKQVHREIAYFDVHWSPLYPVDRHAINASVPSVSGVWELYWLEQSRKPRLLKMGRAWYGGLRNEIRLEADPTQKQNENIAEHLMQGDCYYRYCICESAADLNELYWLLCSIRGMLGPSPPEKRYRDLRLQEDDTMTIFRKRTPKEKHKPIDFTGNRVPNMFDVLEEMRKLESEQQGGREKTR